MRLFLLPISTRRTLIYCDRVASPLTGTGKPTNLHDRIVNKANETWASWENSPNKYKKRLTDYGNTIFNRISYEEWGLKTLPSNGPAQPLEVLFPGRFLEQGRVMGVLQKTATERQGLHSKRFWGSLIGLPFTIPVGLLPVIPNIPGFYLMFRAWSHWKALYGSRYLESVINSKESLIKLSPSKTLDDLYAAGLAYPTREEARQAKETNNLHLEQLPNTVLELLARHTEKTNDSPDVMLLKRWNGKLLAERFGLPGMELEIERAVEQVQKSLESETQQAESDKGTISQVQKSMNDSEKK